MVNRGKQNAIAQGYRVTLDRLSEKKSKEMKMVTTEAVR